MFDYGLNGRCGRFADDKQHSGNRRHDVGARNRYGQQFFSTGDDLRLILISVCGESTTGNEALPLQRSRQSSRRSACQCQGGDCLLSGRAGKVEPDRLNARRTPQRAGSRPLSETFSGKQVVRALAGSGSWFDHQGQPLFTCKIWKRRSRSSFPSLRELKKLV